MDPQTIFCPNLDCPARGRIEGNEIGIHSRKEQRYKCRVCGQTFSIRKGTALYRLHKPEELMVTVMALLAYGCPVAAIVEAYGLDERTVRAWQQRAGEQSERVHQHLVQQPRDLGQVQADEVRVKVQGNILWLAMAIQVQTRLWLGGVLREHRNRDLIMALMQQVRACALCRPLLFCVDGFIAYVGVIQQVFREPVLTGQKGRPMLRPWDDLGIARVIKHYVQRRVIGVVQQVVQGTATQVATLISASQGGGQINTAYIERLNATFRARLAPLVRRSRALARQSRSLQAGMCLVGTVYNFCTDHQSLRIPGIIGGHKWLPRTPAMAAAITDHRWTISELLLLRVPPPPWVRPKKRGRPSLVMRQLVDRWAA